MQQQGNLKHHHHSQSLNFHKKNQKDGNRNQSKLSDFDEELNNLKARNGIFSNKKTKKSQVITLTPSILTSKIMRSPIDISNSNIISKITEDDEYSITPSETKVTNRFEALQESDPFKIVLQPSILSKYVPGSTIDEADL